MKQRISRVTERVSAGAQRVWSGHKKQVIAAGAIAAALVIVATGLLLSAGGGQVAQATSSPSSSQPLPTPTASSTDVIPSPSASDEAGTNVQPDGWAYSDLDGVLAPADLAHRLPMAIMIGDNIPARPQLGFSSASIVYQSYEEYQETRYMMVFQEGTATDIGGLRSARPYFVRWAAEYKALYGHDGGDADSLEHVIPTLSRDIYDEDAARGGYCPYHRTTTRVAPHNEMTNTADLIRCAAKRGYPSTFQNVPTRTFVDDTPLASRAESQSITVPYRRVSVGYSFDPALDSYLRLIDGKPQIDPANNEQVYARNVIVMFQAVTAGTPTYNLQRIVLSNVGSGPAIVFKEGKAITGTWKKPTDTALTRLYDDAGNEIPLVRGEIFIQSVPPGTAVTYK